MDFCWRHKMFLLQLKSDLSVTPRHRMMKTCQEPLSKKLPHVPWRPPDWLKEKASNWRQGLSSSPGCTHLEAEPLWSSYRVPGATSGSGVRHASRSRTLLSAAVCLYLHSPSLTSLPHSPSHALFLSICLAGTTECPWRAGMQQKASLKERALAAKPFIWSYTWPRRACRVARLSGGIRWRREEGMRQGGGEGKWNATSGKEKKGQTKKSTLASLIWIIYLCFCQPQNRGSKWRWVRNRHQRKKEGEGEAEVEQKDERWKDPCGS